MTFLTLTAGAARPTLKPDLMARCPWRPWHWIDVTSSRHTHSSARRVSP
ncbi:MAG: hypothetical protein KBE90_02680 [Ottowia sp.]|nr:hypothetical protein [Ottowia sp.]MBP6666457.1 hypothetical protein [Ottowia sp.]MBP7455467.1 hypothetical protein [Ottowia sp.]MBP7458192.1 hypothetical protein [Ottowia sp.]MBP8861493.1 hypothetical protein [Ottowia sp.]MBP8895763.1 hypothetical protein [Ottowia sp.]